MLHGSESWPVGKENKNSSGDEIAHVNLYTVHPEATRILWNNAKWRPLCRSRSFKVTDFGTNRKLIRFHVSD